MLEELWWCWRMRSLTLLALKQQMEAEVVCFFAHVERWGGPVWEGVGGVGVRPGSGSVAKE